ncbi:putative glycosyltransferase [Oryzomicrobium terrae]|uniref:Putative glycosyltransferase n=1 Tax=Oryzomicrobium terrae TaxID=1735038 RepID=A0A5C1E9L2_9RHOO|nr:undecaprenyl-phosphate glucose phosphotransferase [Oryzomicrobium terrae]QEL65375.1 putative glycosyltransferase [Oryzomicrobium terrae]
MNTTTDPALQAAASVPPPHSHSHSSRFRRPAYPGLGRDNVLSIIEALLEPLVLVLTLWVVDVRVNGALTPPILIVSLVLFSVTFPGPSRLRQPWTRALRGILTSWVVITSLILFCGYATRYIHQFEPRTIETWLWLAPISLVASHLVFRLAAPRLMLAQQAPRRAIIVGINEQGAELARRIAANPYSGVSVLGFFDDRHPARIAEEGDFTLLGAIRDLPEFVKHNRVQILYLSLPMATQPRILQLLDELRDTTASIYFVPDIFLTDLIQGRMDSMCDMPVVAVCETPFTGANGFVKRLSDVVLASLILVLISPLLLLIALAVRLTSKGPVIFRQRRYGLDGQEIIVYKFRSMVVCEDGGTIDQAHKHDARITPLGAFLRKNSLDELPQFVNVLQGRMSIVGPRPHAVAHNELYRKLIKGYMIRHKVKPGITGWAQVNGCRGETDTLEKMRARIDYDLDYLRNWSLRLDLFIILKTVWVMFRDQQAY